jgi:hypothetical protein
VSSLGLAERARAGMHMIAIEPSSAGLMLRHIPLALAKSARCLRPCVATDDGLFAERSAARAAPALTLDGAGDARARLAQASSPPSATTTTR